MKLKKLITGIFVILCLSVFLMESSRYIKTSVKISNSYGSRVAKIEDFSIDKYREEVEEVVQSIREIEKLTIYKLGSHPFYETEFYTERCWEKEIERISVAEVYQWKELVDKVLDENEFTYVNDNYLVMAMIGKESGGHPKLTSTDGYSSVGLMQIVPLSWRPNVSWLKSNYNNILYGAMILEETIEHYEGSVYDGLASYNCGYTSYDAGKCLPIGGATYADKVLDCWYPALQNYEEQLAIDKTIELWYDLVQ